MDSLGPLHDRLRRAGMRVAGTQSQVTSGWPWQVGAVADGGREGEWGPTEVLAHVAEMLAYWLGEMERVVAGTDGHGGGPVHFGRAAGDALRGLTVARDATLPPRELYDRISTALGRYGRRLPEFTAAEVARTGIHPVRGEMSVAELLDQLVVTHLEGHATQLEQALDA